MVSLYFHFFLEIIDLKATINRNEKSIEDLEKELTKIKRAFQEKNEEIKAREKKNEGFLCGFQSEQRFFIDFAAKFRQEKEDLLAEITKKDRVNKEFAAKIEDLNQIYDLYTETKQKVSYFLINFDEICRKSIIFIE